MTPKVTQTEPVALGALVTGLVNGVLLLLAAFDIAELSGEQTAAVFFIVNAIVLTVTAVLTRRVVFSPYTVANDPRLPPLPGTKPGGTPQGDA